MHLYIVLEVEQNMFMSNMVEQVKAAKVVPVVKLNSPEEALPLSEALIEGGLPVAEITFRTDAAEESIRRIAAAHPDMLVGAGTVTSIEQAKRAVDAGAKFAVTPGFSAKITEFCIDSKLPVFPGVCTPSEIMQLIEYDLPVAKFFPAAQYGGVNTIKALSGPFPGMLFMPTGGVSESNIKEYLACKNIVACGGSWMVAEKLIAAKDFEAVKNLTAAVVVLVK